MLPGKMREVEAEQAQEGDLSVAAGLELIIPQLSDSRTTDGQRKRGKAGPTLPRRSIPSLPFPAHRCFCDKPLERLPSCDGGDGIHASIGSEMRNGSASDAAFELARHESLRYSRSRCDRVPNFVRCTGDIDLGRG